jgi:hypothetical protein
VRRVLAALEDNTLVQPEEGTSRNVESSNEVLFSNHAEQQEFEIFRGIVAKNPHASDRELLDLWKGVTGKERETQRVINKFWEYLREARRTLDL